MSHKYVLLKEVCEKASSNIAQKDLAECDGIYPIYGASGYIKSVDFFQQAKDYIAIVKDGAGIGRAMKLPAKSSVIGTMQYVLPKDNINISYLYYAICSMHLEKYFSGATIPHIYFRDYQNEQLPLPTLDEQAKIANVFGRIDYFIKKEKEQLINLDKLVKSRFIEMFGDPKANPKGWRKIPLSHIITNANNGMARRGNDENGSIVLRLVELQEGVIDYSKPNRILLTEKEKDKYLLKDNDFLFARVNGNPLNVGRCAVFHTIGEAVYHNDHIIRVHFDDGKVNGVFASTILNSEYGKDQMRNKIKTSAGQYTISQNGIGAIETIVPPIELQNQFADFVAQVDKSKLAIQQSLDELETLKKSLMQQYFG